MTTTRRRSALAAGTVAHVLRWTERWMGRSWPSFEDQPAEKRYAFELAREHGKRQFDLLICGEVPAATGEWDAGGFMALDVDGTKRLVIVRCAQSVWPVTTVTDEQKRHYRSIAGQWCADRELDAATVIVDIALVMPIGDDNAKIMWIPTKA